MKLKRQYHRILSDAGNPMMEVALDPAGAPIIDPVTHVAKMRLKIMRDEKGNPIVRGVVIKNLPKNGEHRFTPRTVRTGSREGWLTYDEDNGVITIHCLERGEIRFKVQHGPKRVCLHDGIALPGQIEDPAGVVARRYIQEEHGGKLTPHNERWPHGYAVLNYYQTTLEA